MPDRKDKASRDPFFDDVPVIDNSGGKPAAKDPFFDDVPLVQKDVKTVAPAPAPSPAPASLTTPLPQTQPQAELPVSRKPKTLQKDKAPEEAQNDMAYAMDQFQRLTGNEPTPADQVELPVNEQGDAKLSRVWHASGQMDVKATINTPNGTIAKTQQNFPDGTKGYTTDNVTQQELEHARVVAGNEINASSQYLVDDAKGIGKEMMNNAGLGTLNLPDNTAILNIMASPKGGIEELKRYAQWRNQTLQDSYKQKLKDLDGKYTWKLDAYDQEKSAIEKEYQDKSEGLHSALFNVAALKAVNQELDQGYDPKRLSPYMIGLEVEKMLGDEKEVQRSHDNFQYYGQIKPEVKVNRELTGYKALQYAQMDAFARGDDATATAIAQKTKDYVRKTIDNNPAFRKQQVAEAISNEINKNNSFFQNIISGYSLDDATIKKTAEQLGIPEKDLAGITVDDIKRRSDALSEVGNTILRTGIAPLVELAGRHIVNPIMGVSERETNQMYDEDWYDNSWVGKFMGGASPTQAGMTGNKQFVDTNPASSTYLLTLSDDDRSDWRINANTVAATAIDGIGQVAAYAGGGNVAGKALVGLGALSDAEQARRVGLFAFNYLSGYDRNKKYANDVVVGNSVQDEVNRVMLANARTFTEALSEQIYPDYKFADKIFSTTAGRALVDKIAKEGLESVGKESWTKAIAEGAKETGIELFKEGSEESVTELGNAVWDMMFAPKQYQQNDYAQKAWQAGVMGAVSALIPSVAGNVHITQTGPMERRMMFEVGSSPQAYIDQINKDQEAGRVSPQEATGKIKVVNTLSRIVNNSVPEKSVVNNQNLTQTQKEKYADNLLQEALLTEHRENAKDEVQTQAIDKQIEELRKGREQILQSAGPVEVTSEEGAVSVEDGEDGQQVEGQPQEELLQPLALDDGTEDAYGFEGDEEPVNVEPILGPDAVIPGINSPQNNQPNAIEEGNQPQGNLAEHQNGDEGGQAAEASNSNSPQQSGQEQTQQAPVTQDANYQQAANDFFNTPRREMEVEESAKVSDEIKQRFNDAPKVVGRRNTKVLNDGTKVPGVYVLTTAEATTPSHSPGTFSSTEGFPMLEDGRNPNDRDYSIKENKDRVLVRSQNYDGRAAEQVPTVDKNGIVIDGNDRTMSGQLAATQGTDKAYIEALKEKADVFGFTPEAIDEMVASGQHPRVVFVADRIMPYNTETFAAFNPRTTGKVKTSIEEAVQFGRTASTTLLNKIGDAMNRFDTLADFFKNRQATKHVKDFLTHEKILNPDNITGYYDNKNHRFTNAGKELLQNLMLGKVFSEDSLRLLEYFPGVREKMVFAMNNLIAIETLDQNYSLRNHLSDALQLKDRIDDYMQQSNMPMDQKDKGMELYLAQGRLFGDDAVDPRVAIVWALLEDNKKTSMREFTKEYLEKVRQYANQSGQDVFGDYTPTREEIIDYIKNRKEYEQHQKGGEVQGNTAPVNVGEPAGSNGAPVERDIQGGDNAAPVEQGQDGGAVNQQEVATPAAEAQNAINSNEQQPAAPMEEAPVNEQQPPVAEEKPLTPTETYNKYKNDVQKKLRKIELMEEKGDRSSDQWKREQAALKLLKSKMSKAEAEATKSNAKSVADAIRELKIKGGDMALSTPLQIPVAIYNAAVETVASVVELGGNAKAAIQQAVDFINDRWEKQWDEQAFRQSMGEDAAFPLTADQIRAKRQQREGLNQKNRLAADKLVDSVKDNTNTLKSALDYIDRLQGVSPNLKQMLKEYIRSRVASDVFKVTGQELADKHLEGNNYDEALEKLGLDVDTKLLNATSDVERANIRDQYVAAKSYIESRKTLDAVKNGDVTPVSTRVQPVEDQFTLPKRTTAKAIQEWTQDRFSRLEQAQRSSKKPVTEVSDAVTALRLARSKAWHRIAQVRDFLGNVEYKKGSFYDRLKQAGITIDRFGLYLYAKHAQERNAYNAGIRQEAFDAKVYDLNQKIADAASPEAARGFQQRLDKVLAQEDPKFVLMPDGGSGMTNEQAQQILDEIEKDGDTQKFEDFENEFREQVVDKILDFKFDSGIIDAETYNHLKTFYSNYVPLKVDEDEESGTGDQQTIKRSGKNGRDLYRSKGSVERSFMERNNPMLQAMVDLETSIVKGEQNIANNRLANLAKLNPNDAVWEIKDAQYDMLRDKNGKVIVSREIDSPKSAVAYFDNGKKKYVVLHDPGLQNAFKHLGSEKFNKWVSMPSRWFTAVNTLTNVDFLLRNPFVDQQDAYMVLLGNKNPEIVKKFRSYIPQAAKVAYQMFRGKGGEWNKWRDEWKDAGGEITFMEQINLDKHVDKTMKIFESYGKTFSLSRKNTLMHGLSEMATTMEQMTRVMAYRAAREAGETKEQSALISRNATVDFEKKGVAGSYINAFKAFANAGTQGFANLTYAAVKSGRVRKFLGAMVAMGFLESLFNDLAGDCDEKTGEDCYWEKQEWEKERNLIIKNPAGGFIDVPIGRAFGWFNYLGKNVYRAVKTAATDAGPDEGAIGVGDFAANSLGALFGYYNPVGGSSPVEQQFAGNFAPVVQLATNKNAFGSTLKPDNYQGLPEHRNFFPTTDKAFVEAAKVMSTATGGSARRDGLVEVSPNTLSFLYQTAFGGLGNWIYDAAAAPINAAQGNKVEAKDIPVSRIFYRENNMGATKSRYFETADRSESKLLPKKDLVQLKEDLDALVESGQITPEQRGKRWGYVMKNQKRILRNRSKEEGEDESGSGDNEINLDDLEDLDD